MTPDETQSQINSHFDRAEENVKEVYAALLRMLCELGPVAVEPKKTCLHLVNRTALAGVYPKRQVLQLEFKSDYPITDPLVVKTEQISRNRWHHIVRLSSPSDLQNPIASWIRDSYALSG